MPSSTIERFNVLSTDHVEISVQKAGAGTSLLLVHGALLNAQVWWGALARRLADHFTVYVMNRRGRAPSGDAKDYSFSAEAGDIARVAESIDGPVSVLAHSYGALLTMEASERLKNASQFVLYEPPMTLAPAERVNSDKIVCDMERALEKNDRAETVRVFLRDQVQMPPEYLRAFQCSPRWPVALEIAHTLPRETRAVNTYRPWAERLAKWQTPTTMLLGTETTTHELKDGAIFVSEAIPGCRLVMLEGQGHAAMLDAPDFFAAKIMEIMKGHK